LPPARFAVFQQRWPAFFQHTDPLRWDDDKTANAERYWREATGHAIPAEARPPRFSDVKRVRSTDDAYRVARDVQATLAGLRVKTVIEAGEGNRGGHVRHYNDLNNLIFHDARDMLTLPPEAIVFLSAHEVGHSKWYPATRARAEFDRALMAMHDAKNRGGKWFGTTGATWGGKSTPSLFQNWLGDQIINHRMQFSARFGEQFHRGLFWMLTNNPGQREARGSSWFFKMHFRLLWASAIKHAGGVIDNGRFVPITDVASIPPIVKVNGNAFPQVTYHDGPDWLRLPNGKHRLPELWKAINDVSAARVRNNLPIIMDLSEPFFFPPRDIVPTTNNPDGIACPRCKKADRVNVTPDAVDDPQRPGERLPRIECHGCHVHTDPRFKGVWTFDRDTNRNVKTVEA
jgi:hypothetical protein